MLYNDGFLETEENYVQVKLHIANGFNVCRKMLVFIVFNKTFAKRSEHTWETSVERFGQCLKKARYPVVISCVCGDSGETLMHGITSHSLPNVTPQYYNTAGFDCLLDNIHCE